MAAAFLLVAVFVGILALASRELPADPKLIQVLLFAFKVGSTGGLSLGAALYAAAFASPVPAVVRFVIAGSAVVVGCWGTFTWMERRLT